MKSIFVLILASALALFGCSNSGDSVYFPLATTTTSAPEVTTPVNTGTQETGNGTGNETGNEQTEETNQPQEQDQTENPNSNGEENNNQGTEPESKESGNTNQQTPIILKTTVVNFIVNGTIVDTVTKKVNSTSEYAYIGYSDNTPMKMKSVPTKETVVEYPEDDVNTTKSETVETGTYKVYPGNNDSTVITIPTVKHVTEVTTTKKFKKTTSYEFIGWEVENDGSIFGLNELHPFKNGTTVNVIAKFNSNEDIDEESSVTSKDYDLVRTLVHSGNEKSVITTENAITYGELLNKMGGNKTATESLVRNESEGIILLESNGSELKLFKYQRDPENGKSFKVEVPNGTETSYYWCDWKKTNEKSN